MYSGHSLLLSVLLALAYLELVFAACALTDIDSYSVQLKTYWQDLKP